jgi:hypothetical protein
MPKIWDLVRASFWFGVPPNTLGPEHGKSPFRNPSVLWGKLELWDILPIIFYLINYCHTQKTWPHTISPTSDVAKTG